MTYPRLFAIAAAVLVAAAVILTFTDPGRLDLPDDRPAEYYPTGPVTPPAREG